MYEVIRAKAYEAAVAEDIGLFLYIRSQLNPTVVSTVVTSDHIRTEQLILHKSQQIAVGADIEQHRHAAVHREAFSYLLFL